MNNNELALLSPLVDDNSFNGTVVLKEVSTSDGLTSVLTYIATRPGLYTLDFQPGFREQTYSFTPTVVPGPAAVSGVGTPFILPAPAVAPGITNFGDTRAGERFWRLPLQAGQLLTVNWTNNDPLGSRDDDVCLYGPSADDNSLAGSLESGVAGGGLSGTLS